MCFFSSTTSTVALASYSLTGSRDIAILQTTIAMTYVYIAINISFKSLIVHVIY